MATILGLALKVTADASGLPKALTPVERALASLGQKADDSARLFDQFKASTVGAAAAQASVQAKFEQLSNSLQANEIDAQAYAAGFAAIQAEAKATAAAFAEGVKATEQYRTAEERRASQLERIVELERLGAISSETATRARDELTGANERAAAAEKARADAASAAAAEGARLTQQFTTDAEKRAASLDRVEELLRAGAINEETAARARAELTGANEEAAKAEKARADSLAEGARLTQQFASADEKRSAELDRIAELLRVGAINEETAARAKAEVSGANQEAAKAEKARADALASASRIIAANATPQEKYDQQVQELSDHLDAGRLTQEQFNRAMKKARSDLDNAGKAAEKTDKSISELVRNTRILAGIEIGRLFVDGVQLIGNLFQSVTSQVTSLASSVNANIDRLSDFSARTGIGVEALQGYSIAAKLAGVDTEQFGTAIQKLAVNIGKATPGDEMDKSLKQINLSVAELRVLSPEQQFSAIGNAISQLPTAAERAAAAVESFGKQGAALAPLFREGAASIEELQAKAKRLGIIVSDTQVNNVADMNEAFDLVRATVEGIIGQVIGNLAPAVTSVTEEFLKFVELWTGAQGQGGTGIANAITDVLLKGADYLAGIFDTFSVNLGNIGEAFTFAAEIIDIGSKGFVAASESLRAVFNLFQLGIDTLLIGLGDFLQGIGSWVSDDLEQFGAGLAAASRENAQRNAEEFEAAATNAANAVNGIFGGAAGAAAGQGQGAAQQFVSGLRSGIEQARLPEVKVQADLGDAQDRLAAYFKTAKDGGGVFFQQSQETLDLFQQMTEQGGLTADQIAVMNGFMDDLNSKLDQENAKRKKAAEAAAKQAKADQQIIDKLIEKNQAEVEAENNLLAVAREQQRVTEQLTAARLASDEAAANAAAARLAELDQVQAKLEEQQQAADQGFGEGFQKAFDKATESITKSIEKAKEFGAAGVNAAQQYADGVARAQEQARDGILKADTYEAEVARLQKIFDDQVARLEVLKNREIENKRLAAQSQIDANERVEQFLRSNLASRTKAELEAADAVTKRRTEALENVRALEERIAVQRKSVEAARESGDIQSAKARQTELKQLEAARLAESKIANGQVRQQQQLNAEQSDSQAAFAEAQRQQYEKAAQQQQALAEQQAKAQAAEAERQANRIRELNTIGQQAVQGTDIRTTAGANLVQDLAANAQDPALIQQRQQTKLLEAIALSTAQSAANYLGRVAIVGSAQLG